MRIIPAIDLLGGKTVRLEQGEYDRRLDYDVSPVDAAVMWEKMGAELVHVVDLDGAKEGTPVNLPLIKRIASKVKIPIQAGGGFRSKDDIRKALDAGVWRVVVGSRAFEDIAFAEECLASFGEKIIFSGDAKDLEVRSEGWKKNTGLNLIGLLQAFVSLGAGEIIYTDIARDGTLAGPSIGNLERILKRMKVKLIAAGGVRNIEHIRELKKLEKLGLSGVIIGRALYDKTIDFREALDVGKEDNTVS